LGSIHFITHYDDVPGKENPVTVNDEMVVGLVEKDMLFWPVLAQAGVCENTA
jgi:hypothetical protein